MTYCGRRWGGDGMVRSKWIELNRGRIGVRWPELGAAEWSGVAEWELRPPSSDQLARRQACHHVLPTTPNQPTPTPSPGQTNTNTNTTVTNNNSTITNFDHRNCHLHRHHWHPNKHIITKNTRCHKTTSKSLDISWILTWYYSLLALDTTTTNHFSWQQHNDIVECKQAVFLHVCFCLCSFATWLWKLPGD